MAKSSIFEYQTRDELIETAINLQKKIRNKDIKLDDAERKLRRLGCETELLSVFECQLEIKRLQQANHALMVALDQEKATRNHTENCLRDILNAQTPGTLRNAFMCLKR